MHPTVELIWGGNSFGLIVLCGSGVFYTNQTGGLACNHPVAEGVFVPLDDGVGRPTQYRLSQHFRGSWEALNEEDAKVIDTALKSGNLGFVSVSRKRLSESTEAWVHVELDLSKCGELLSNFEDNKAILTWENSD